MTLEINNNEMLYELLPLGAFSGKKAIYLRKNRVIIGRSGHCDIVLDNGEVSSIHAVLEISKDGFKLYDMKSGSGTYVNGEKVVVREFSLNDQIKFGPLEFSFKKYVEEEVGPPALDLLRPKLPPVMPGQPSAAAAAVNSHKKPLPVSSPITGNIVPSVVYPLAKDPNADFSEYIFEDTECLYPIFKYNTSLDSVEVIILFDDQIFSVDYLPVVDGRYRLVGSNAKSNDIEYAYLGQKEKVDFIKVQDNQVRVNALAGYDAFCIGNEKLNLKDSIPLDDDNILRFENGLIQVFVRRTVSPPKVAHAPILRRDKEFIKYLGLVFLFIIMFLGALTLYTVDKEVEKEKAPERIATILYKAKKLVVSKTKAIDKTKNKPKKVVQKSPSKKRVKKKLTPKKTKVTPKKKIAKRKPKTGVKSAKKVGLIKKASANKGPQDNLKTKRVVPKKSKVAGKASRSKTTTRRSKVSSKSKGSVDTFKSLDFSSSLSSLMAKGGSLKSANAVSTFSVSQGNVGAVVGAKGATLKRAKLSKNMGSLAGSARGTLDSSKGVEGLSNKKNIYTAGLPFEEVILGGMDPDMIRKILIDHIPQFRHCYQKELDQASNQFSGVVRLDFIIGASGHVTRAGVETTSKGLKGAVKGCVVNVLRGIRFPEPKGGGTVQVNQPFNFYPRTR